MARPCRLVRGGRAVDAQWRRDGDALVLSPAGGPTLVVALERLAGIAGDGHTVRLLLPEGEISLERLGADGPTLLGDLRRDWPPLRAAVLRLADGGRPTQLHGGTITAPDLSGDFLGFVAEGRLLLATGGGDLSPLYPADWAAVVRDDDACAVRCRRWDGAELVFSRLGAKTGAFAEALRVARERLALAADAALSRHLPSLAAAARGALAEQWLPGRLLSAAQLESVAPGFQAAFELSWLPLMPRALEARALMQGVAAQERLIGYGFLAGQAAESWAEEAPHVWLLVRRADAWSFELLSHGDYATYRFRGGDEVPGLVEGLIRLPEFSREALYLPVEELVGDRSRYEVPVRDLPLLRGLRSHFLERIIHTVGSSGPQG